MLQGEAGGRLQLPLPMVISLIPAIKPRAYSISSAPSYHGESIVELCILTYEWEGKELVSSASDYMTGEILKKAEKTRLRPGLCSNYLRDVEAGAYVYCAIKPAAMEAPPLETDVFCSGIGSGVAPLLGYLYDRVAAAQ